MVFAVWGMEQRIIGILAAGKFSIGEKSLQHSLTSGQNV
jgi:hypothetical protein